MDGVSIYPVGVLPVEASSGAVCTLLHCPASLMWFPVLFFHALPKTMLHFKISSLSCARSRCCVKE